MDVILLSRIGKYKKAGWKIDEDSSGIALWGVGYFTSPRGNCFTFEEMRESRGVPDWDVHLDEDVKEVRRFGRLYKLVDDFCFSCYLGQGIEKLFD